MPDDSMKTGPPGEPLKAEADAKHVDEGWKEEARREKERLAREAEAKDKSPGPAPTDGSQHTTLPEPSFDLMITNLAIQALIALGDIANPVTHEQECDLEQAKHTIDLLGILEEKTKGNLTEKEKRHLDGTLYELRTRYLQAGRG